MICRRVTPAPGSFNIAAANLAASLSIMIAYLSHKSWLLALLTINTSLAFIPSKPLSVQKGKDFRLFSTEDGDWIKTVNSKEIFFDEKNGRFFETKKEYEEDKGEGEVSGPFPANPFKKPTGTFFDDLKNRKEEAPAKKPDAPKKEESAGFSMGNIFEREEAVSAPVARPVAPESNSPLGFLGDLFKPKEDPVSEEAEAVYYAPVTIASDFRVAGALLAAAYLLDQIPYIQLTLGPIVTLLGVLFLLQSFRVRFVFNDQNELELMTVKDVLTGTTESSGENVVVGGENIWACDTIVNYDFFPPIDSSPVGPILVYFKETQTDSKLWNEGPGLLANNKEKIEAGEAVAGQVHFFPAVCNAEQIREEFEKRGCGKL